MRGDDKQKMGMLELNFFLLPRWADLNSNLLCPFQFNNMTDLQTTTSDKFIFDKAVKTKFLGVSKSGASIYTGDVLAPFCIGSVPNGGKDHSKSKEETRQSICTLSYWHELVTFNFVKDTFLLSCFRLSCNIIASVIKQTPLPWTASSQQRQGPALAWLRSMTSNAAVKDIVYLEHSLKCPR